MQEAKDESSLDESERFLEEPENQSVPLEIQQRNEALFNKMVSILEANSLISNDILSDETVVEYIEHELRESPDFDATEALNLLLQNNFFVLLDEDQDAECYADILKSIAKQVEGLDITVNKTEYQENNNRILMDVTIDGEKETWGFTHFARNLSDSFLVHIALILNAKAKSLLHFDYADDWSAAVVLKESVVAELNDAFGFAGQPITQEQI